MSRKSRRSAIGIQLFPFLAVLICTMGALIVLLMLMVQQARVDAKTEVAAARQPNPDAERRQREAFEDEVWRREMLEQQRTEKTAELAEKRLQLSHLEDHIRRLQQQAEQLLKQAQNIDRGKQLKDDDLARSQAELDRLNDQIAAKKKELDELKKKGAPNRGYALIPYDGPNGTRRRPIYIECTDMGVVLQPEGILFKPDDFSGPLGPGNPLDAALRATREYIAQAGAAAGGEPYPLLVVRPSGIVAFGAARAAMKSWEEEFGYELVAEDKPLVFGNPDPALRRILGQTVATARQKQAIMVAAMPRRFQEDETLTSFAPEDQPELRDHLTGTGRGIGGGGGSANGTGTGSGVAGQGSGTSSRGGNAPAGAGSSGGSPTAQFAGHSPGSSSTGGVAGGGDLGAAVGARPGQNKIALSNPFGGGNGATHQSGASPDDGASANPSPNDASAPSGSPGARPGNNRYAKSAGTSSTPSANHGNAPSGTASSQSSGQPGGSSSSSHSASSSAKSSKSRAPRGNNWGLPGAREHTTAITRPIRVVCFRDKLIVLPERGDGRAAQVIYISPDLTLTETDAFVRVIQDHMNSWGLAVANGYWKPELHIEVAADAESQFANLQSALDGSGFDVRRKTP